MDKIKIFKEKALAIEVNVMLDYYPGNPIYIGKDSDEKRDKYLKKYATENNIELPKAEGALHYYPVYTSENQMESYYNDTIFSIPDMSLDYLSSALKELEAYSYKELFDAISVLSSRFANEEVMCIAAKHDTMRFKNIFNRQFKNKLPIAGRITSYFIGSMRKEIRLKERYLEMLKNKVKDVIDIKLENIKKVTQLTSLANRDSKILNDKFEDKKQEISNSVTNSNNTKMTPQTKTLFNFIDFLHGNIDNFNQYDNTILELNKTRERISQLGFHYTEVREKRALEKKFNEKWDVIFRNIVNPIKDKVAELELFDWYAPETLSNNYFHIANTLSKTYDDKDLDAILNAKTQYIEFTNKISPRVIHLAERVFEYLHESMVEIAKNFYKEGDKRIKHQKKKQVETFQELVEGFKAGEKVAMPLLLNNLSQSGATKEVNPEGHIVSINSERENTEEKEVFEQIKELTNEEYIERDYHYGSKGSTQSTMDFNIISHIFKEIHNDLNDKFKLFFFNGKVDLLQRIKILLANEVEKLESIYDFRKLLLGVTLKDGNKDSTKNLKKQIFIFETKIEHIKKLLDLLNSFSNTIAHKDNFDETPSSPEDVLNELETKEKQEEIVDIKRLSKYFHLSFLGENKYKANYLTENLINDLKILTDGKKVAHLALLIYDSKQINKLKPSTFSEWHTIFCECIDKNKVDYKRCKLKDLGQDFKEIFYYITPKIK